MPLETGSQNAAYAIYALKYFPDLKPVLTETSRILKSGGLFLVYDLIKTDLYNENNNNHRYFIIIKYFILTKNFFHKKNYIKIKIIFRDILKQLEFACGMPSLYTRKQLLDCCELLGLKLIKAIDINVESGQPFYYCFTSSPFFMWLIKSVINFNLF